MPARSRSPRPRDLLAAQGQRRLRCLSWLRWPACLLCLLCLLPAPALHAQQEATPPAEGPPRAEETIVTADRHEEQVQDVPYTISIIDEQELRSGPDARSMPNALTREPGVLLQKTGPGQSSPYIRGFTGFRNVLMVDGIRINNSVFREGPNQYWSLVDQFSIERLELVRGPSSVLWGSDAIGGAVNALTVDPDATDGWHGQYFVRWSSAERALFNRLEVEGGEEGSYALSAGVTYKNYGDLKAGSSGTGNGDGDLPGTSFDEYDVDFRLDIPVEEDIELTFAGQHVEQRDAPRTHTTVDAVPFEGTTAGTDLERNLTQKRDLLYGRLVWEAEQGLYDQGRFTLSYQREQETQDRLRTGGKFDTSGFDVHTYGAQLEYNKDTSVGLVTWGIENFYDDVSSFRRDFVDGVLTLDEIQGPVADDARYNLFGAYVQDEFSHGPYDTTVGVRYSYASADANDVDNPNVAGADPATPGNIISVNESWDALVGSVRTLRHMSEDTEVYAGLSQGFRAPNLSDLTSELTDSGIESPTPDLDPEYYVQLELGTRTQQDTWSGDVAVYYTWIDDMVIQSPTGEFIDGVPVLTKSNVGDGTLYGIEGRWSWLFDPEWTAYASAGYLASAVDQFTDDGEQVSAPISRQMPFTSVLGTTFQPVDADWWVQGDTFFSAKADQLSPKDESDTQRIPPGGTPGYGIVGVRAGRQLTPGITMTVAVENIFDASYRIHGSGVNEPGRSLVLTLGVRF